LKERFEALLRNTIAKYQSNFIGEEATHNQETIASSMGIPWENIDMSIPLRESCVIAEEQRSRPWYPKYVGPDAKPRFTGEGYEKLAGGGWVTVQTRVASDAVREIYMFDRVVQESGGARSLMIICGIAHSQALAKLFREEYGDCVHIEPWEVTSA
jgi:hypothetical protein